MNISSKRILLSLRAKLTLLIECFVVILVAATGIIVTLHERETLVNELRKRGVALASDLANFIARPLINRDLATLRRLVNNSMKQEFVRYVAVLDPDGRVVMHNELSEIGKIYKNISNTDALESNESRYTTVQKSNREEAYTVISSPVTVSTLRLGTVLLGYSHLAVPWSEWQAMRRCDDGTVPNEVVNMVFDNDWSPMHAWREYLGLTQAEVARRLGVSQAAYAQTETKAKPRKTTLAKVAAALGLTLEQVDF